MCVCVQTSSQIQVPVFDDSLVQTRAIARCLLFGEMDFRNIIGTAFRDSMGISEKIVKNSKI